MKYTEALSNLRFKKENRFILAGKEAFLKHAFIKTVEKIYSQEKYTFYPDSEKDALDLLGSQSFFGDFLLILCDFDEMKVPVFERFLEVFKGPLILTLTEKADIKSRLMTKIISNFTVVDCVKFKDYGPEYPLWVKMHIMDSGYTAEDKVEDLIFSKIGPSLFSLSSEIEKLFIVKSTDKIIRIIDVENYVSVTAVDTLFDLFENLLKRDVRGALKCFNSYSKNQENFIDVVYFLGTYFEKMFRLCLLLEKKTDLDTISDFIGIHKYLIKTRYQSRVISLGKVYIAFKIDSLCKLSQQLVFFKGSKRTLFEKFIMEFAQ